jgi:hypothetical protein
MNWFLDPYNYVLVAMIFTVLSAFQRSYQTGKTQDPLSFFSYLIIHALLLLWQLQILLNKS